MKKSVRFGVSGLFFKFNLFHLTAIGLAPGGLPKNL
jgi:hypothetical protein